ncbi:V4R domain-containing protein [Methylomagnum sp.]
MSILPTDGGFAGYHNYYVPEEFFRRDSERGAIHLRDGQRTAAVDESFINGLHLGVEEEVGSASSLLMYRCGQRWAQQDMKRFSDRMRHEFGGDKRDIWTMNLRFVLETWWWPLTVEGYGAWRLDMTYRAKDITIVEIRNSAVAQSMAQVGKPVCHLYAGLFAGAFSFYDKTERECIELQCYAMGNDVCKFMIAAEKQINAVEFWRQEGATASEILTNFDP